MSIEFKMSRGNNGRKSRLYKRTKRASLNRIDAPHLPMRVHSDKGREIFKDPKTDSGTKKSLKGLISVELMSDGTYKAIDQVTPQQEQLGNLETVFEDGKLLKDWSLRDIRKNVDESILSSLQ